MKRYESYIFDLYGTLIDILTDETSPAFWRGIAGLYGCRGAKYGPRTMRESYLALCREEEDALRRRTGEEYPEIELRTVFRRLLTEAKGTPATDDPDGFVEAAAAVFRVLSRKRFNVYPGVHDALKELRGRGARLFLLSNAQEVFTLDELRLAGLNGYFERVFISSAHGIRKPQPAFLEKLIEECGIDRGRAVMVGNDIFSDMRIADACGIDGILLNTDGLSGEEIEMRIKECGIESPERLTPILSGDIRELLG